MAMNKLFKQFVAFAIVAVMLCGLIPVSAMAVEHDHDHQHSDIAPFSSSADLIEQVKGAAALFGVAVSCHKGACHKIASIVNHGNLARHFCQFVFDKCVVFGSQFILELFGEWKSL